MSLLRHRPLPEGASLNRGMMVYWTLLSMCILVGLIALAIVPVGHEILWLNTCRSFWLDGFFRFATRLGEEWAYVVILLILLFTRYKAAMALPLLAIVVTLIAGLSKAWFAHDRPFPFFTKLGLWHQLQPVAGVELLQGATSFPSGHTMSAFALYTFAALNLPRKTWISLTLLLAAVLTGFSRMYLLQHFLKDVLAGAMLGVLLAIGCHLLLVRYWKEI